jgi:hypothetical protein
VGHRFDPIQIRSPKEEAAAPPHGAVERHSRRQALMEKLPDLESHPAESADELGGATEPGYGSGHGGGAMSHVVP